jgi:hypothetical protein
MVEENDLKRVKIQIMAAKDIPVRAMGCRARRGEG